MNGNGYLYRVEQGYDMSYKDFGAQVKREKLDTSNIGLNLSS
jgi:hypothetical protein